MMTAASGNKAGNLNICSGGIDYTRSLRAAAGGHSEKLLRMRFWPTLKEHEEKFGNSPKFS
jgi:hypothetical protein